MATVEARVHPALLKEGAFWRRLTVSTRGADGEPVMGTSLFYGKGGHATYRYERG